MLEVVRDSLFGKKWDKDSLETSYARVYLPAAFDQEDNGHCEWSITDSWEDDITATMLPELFTLKDSVEASNPGESW